MWYGSEEKKRLDAAKLEIKERYIQSIERHRRRDDGTPLDPDPGATATSSGEVATITTTTTVPVTVRIPVQVAEKDRVQKRRREMSFGSSMKVWMRSGRVSRIHDGDR